MGDGPTDVRALRRAMKKARKAWRANKDDKTLRKGKQLPGPAFVVFVLPLG